MCAGHQCARASPDLLRIDDGLAHHRLDVELTQVGKELVPRLPRGEQCGADASCERRLLLLFNTTRTTSGPPSTGAAIAMDGGVADTQPAITQAVSRRRF